MKKDGDMIWKWIAMGADKHETSVGNKRVSTAFGIYTDVPWSLYPPGSTKL